MRESRTYGSVRGALSNERPYRDRFARNDGLGCLKIESEMHGLLVRQASWRFPAGERPVRVGRSGRPVASVAWSPATAGAKRTQRLCGVCY